MMSKAQDVPNGEGLSLLQRWWFYWAGFLACAMNGKLGRYSYYLAQARVEQGDDLSGTGMVAYSNPFNMHESEFTTRAASFTPFDGGSFAVYSSWWGPVCKYYGAWKDRFAWDERYVSQSALNIDQWAAQVAGNGYMGGSAATDEQRAIYAASLVASYKRMSGVSKWFDDDEGYPWMTWLFWLVVVGVLGFAVYKTYQWYSKRRKK